MTTPLNELSKDLLDINHDMNNFSFNEQNDIRLQPNSVRSELSSKHAESTEILV